MLDGKGIAPTVVAKAAGPAGSLTVKAFRHALPDIAAATRVWRPLFTSTDEVATEAVALIKRGLAA